MVTHSLPSHNSSILGFFLMGAAYLAIGLFISSLTESQVIAAVISFIVMVFTYLMTSLASLLPTDHISVLVCMIIAVIIIALIAYAMMHNYIVSIGIVIVGAAALVIVYFVHPSFYDGLIVNISQLVFRCRQNSILSHFAIMDVSSLLYYISVVFIFIFFTVTRIKKKRWS